MKFTIDAILKCGEIYEKEAPFFYKKVRKTEQGTWRSLTDIAIKEGDIVIDSIDHYYPSDKVVVYDGVKCPTEHPLGLSLKDNFAELYPCVHRDEKPYHFTIGDVESAIRKGDDSQTSCLSVLLDGSLKLAKVREENPVKDPRFAVSCEFFVGGNGYVGEEAAKDESHLRLCYNVLLEQWVEHLETGKPMLHSTDPPGESIEYLERKRFEMEKKFDL